MSEYVQVQVAVDERAKAAELAASAVRARLAACVQIVGPVTSVFRWKGEVETAEEYLLLIKTTRERSGELSEHIRRAHPYETPEIILLPVEGGLPAYLRWIDEETSPDPEGQERATGG
ncbi:divalent-cation tolerance protein CutA [Sphaerisporangium sp. NPDC005289]|uniref:divalent-cation tolerance protein CutA n=1 Tax=Sphaerisporangium sp. NPDC005289 TaxID=3155247 RepID=UPI0033BDE1B9